jgi:hypothetical protein
MVGRGFINSNPAYQASSFRIRLDFSKIRTLDEFWHRQRSLQGLSSYLEYFGHNPGITA